MAKNGYKALYYISIRYLIDVVFNQFGPKTEKLAALFTLSMK